jgi:hypothetical protein
MRANARAGGCSGSRNRRGGEKATSRRSLGSLVASLPLIVTVALLAGPFASFATASITGTPGVLATISMPSSGSTCGTGGTTACNTAEPTGVVVNTSSHVGYVATLDGNQVVKLSNTNCTSSCSFSPTNVSSTLLPNLNFPGALALNGSNVYASNFCYNTTGTSQFTLCKTAPTGSGCGGTCGNAFVSQQNGTGGTQGTGQTCKNPSGIAFTSASSTQREFVACAGSGSVLVNPSPPGGSSGWVSSGSLGTGAVPSGVTANAADTSFASAILADAGQDTLNIIEYAFGNFFIADSEDLPSGCQPAYVAEGTVTTSGGTRAPLFVACPGTGTVAVGRLTSSLNINPDFGSVTLPTPSGGTTPSPYGVAVNASGNALVVTDSANGQADVYALQTSPANVPGGLVCTGTNVGVDSSGTHTGSQASGCTAPAQVKVGDTPDGVAIDGTNAFIANEGSANVTVIDPPADLVAANKDQAGAGGIEKLTKVASKTRRRRKKHTVDKMVKVGAARVRLRNRLEPLVAPIPGRIGS